MLVGQGALDATDEVLAVAERLGAGDHHGTARQGRRSRRRPVPHPAAGTARIETQLRHDAGLRHAADGGHELPLQRVPASDRPSPWRADRPASSPPEPPLPDGGQPLGRREDDACRAAATPRAARATGVGSTASSTAMSEWKDVLAAAAQTPADPINPRLAFHLLNERLPEDAIVTADAGTTADWYGNHIALGRNMMGNLSGRLATMLGVDAVCHRGQVRIPRTSGRVHDRRRCLPDAGHERVDHREATLEGMGRTRASSCSSSTTTISIR